MRMRALWACLALLWPAPARAQLDPVERRLVQFGYDRTLSGAAPLGGYLFYYRNIPRWRERAALRLALAPVYLDAELGLPGALGEHTDLALGAAGGGFARSHAEIRGGRFLDAESYAGHGAELSVSAYRRLNPGARVPLSAALRLSGDYAVHSARAETAAGFVAPADLPSVGLRAGLRLGGREPLLQAPRALELSAWYAARWRAGDGPYGLSGDRRIERDAHLFWGRALLNYARPGTAWESGAALTAGVSVRPDRLAAFRLGGGLRLDSEFPLVLPGYMSDELTARRFALLEGRRQLHFGPQGRVSAGLTGAVAYVDYLPGMAQPGSIHAGAGSLLGYQAASRIWQALLGYGYGLAALRAGGRGAHSVSVTAQWNIGAPGGARGPRGPALDRPLWRFLRRLLP